MKALPFCSHPSVIAVANLTLEVFRFSLTYSGLSFRECRPLTNTNSYYYILSVWWTFNLVALSLTLGISEASHQAACWVCRRSGSQGWTGCPHRRRRAGRSGSVSRPARPPPGPGRARTPRSSGSTWSYGTASPWRNDRFRGSMLLARIITFQSSCPKKT